jgi:hypothetical protein
MAAPGNLVSRLQRMQDVFQNISSPQHLLDCMQESGSILAQLLQLKELKLPADDVDRDRAAAAMAEPIPRWNTSGIEQNRQALWKMYADRYSDCLRTVLHTKPATQQWTVTRKVGDTVTQEHLPQTAVIQQTNWTEDYKQQGYRYGLFVSELLAELQQVPDAVPTATPSDADSSTTTSGQDASISQRKPPAVLAEILRRKISTDYKYPGSYTKLKQQIGGSVGTWTNIFNHPDNADLQAWRDDKSVSARNHQELVEHAAEHNDDEYLPDDELLKLFEKEVKKLPAKDRAEARKVFSKMDITAKRKYISVYS